MLHTLAGNGIDLTHLTKADLDGLFPLAEPYGGAQRVSLKPGVKLSELIYKIPDRHARDTGGKIFRIEPPNATAAAAGKEAGKG